MNGHDETVRHLGVLLGLAAEDVRRGDDEAFARCEYALNAIKDFDPWHGRVLRALVQTWESMPESRPENERRRAEEFGVTALARIARLDEGDLIARAIDLENAGLAQEGALMAGDDKGFFPTWLGITLVHAAQVIED